MIYKRNTYKVLCSLFVTFALIYLWSIYQDLSSSKAQIVTEETSKDETIIKASEEEEDTEEDYEEEVIILWDEFNHVDVKMNKDIFFIESSGQVLNLTILVY